MTLTALLHYLTAHWLEAVGVVLSLAYLYCSIRGLAMLWVLGIISSSIYVVVYVQSKFYADMTIQLYYIVVSVYGLWLWLRGTRGDADTSAAGVGASDRRGRLPMTHARVSECLWLSLAALVIWAVYWAVLYFLTDSPVPMGDALTTSLCIVATWLLVHKRVENWLVFIVADGISAGLYAWKSLWLTSGLFVVYTVMAVVGYVRWMRLMQAEGDTGV